MFGQQQQQPPRYGNQQGFPPQQQQQQHYPQQQYPQQQQMQMYPQQSGQYGQQQQQFGGPGGWPQPATQYPCCPEDPNEHFCNTDPTQMGPNGQPASFVGCLWQMADATTWFVLLMFLASTIGFGITVGAKGTDDLLSAMEADSMAELRSVAFYDNLNNVDEWIRRTNGTDAPSTTPAPTPAPLQTVIVNGTRIVIPQTAVPTTTGSAPMTTASALASRFRLRRLLQAATAVRVNPPVRPCNDSHRLAGTFGVVCAEDSLDAMPMLMNQSRWLVFRGTLYFLAMMGSLALLVIIVVVNKQKASLDPNGGMQQGQYGAPAVSPPYNFHGTPLYYSFRMAWGAVSVIVFFWMVTEMYQYWWFIGYYKDRTSGKLHDFWVGFDKKFVPATICVGLFLCWPLAHLGLELAFFIIGFIPWFGMKQCYVQLQAPGPQIDEDKPFDSHSCCIRTNMFYGDFHQAHRLGFSEGQWVLLTGSREPFCRALECAPQPQQYGGGPMGAAPPMQGGAYPSQPPRPGQSMGGPTQHQQQQPDLAADQSRGGSFQHSQSFAEESPRKKDKKDKKDKSEKKEKKDKDKKDKKDKHRKSTGSLNTSRSFAAADDSN